MENHQELYMKIETSAPGKIFLTGEYMALEGGRSIVLSTPQKTKVSITDNYGKSNIFSSSMSKHDYPFEINEEIDIVWLRDDPMELGSILKNAVKRYGRYFTNKSIHIDTNEFFSEKRKIGIGSSAAVTVSITKALNQLFGLGLEPKEIIDYALEIHAKSQKSNGSGFDVITSYSGAKAVSCRLRYEGGYEYSQVQLPKEIMVIAVLSNSCARTSTMIERYQSAKKKHPRYFSKQSKIMKRELEVIYSSILNKDTKLILKNLATYNDLLFELDKKLQVGIFDYHHEMMELAKSMSIFYKPSGAGGGDLGLIVCDDNAKINLICETLDVKGINFFEI